MSRGFPKAAPRSTWYLCADGTLHASGSTLIYRTAYYHFTFDGRWSVISAARGKSRVAFTTANYQADNPPTVQANPPPEAGVLGLGIKARSSVVIRDDGGLFDPPVPTLSRTALPSGACPLVGAPAGA